MFCPHIYLGFLERKGSKLHYLGEAVITILNIQEKQDKQQKKEN